MNRQSHGAIYRAAQDSGEPALVVMIISLFFGVRYSFSGSMDSRTANRVLHKAGDFAQDIKDEFVPKDESMPKEGMPKEGMPKEGMAKNA